MRKSPLEKPQMKINSLKKLKHGYLFHTFKGTVRNPTLSSYNEGSIQITLL